MQLLLALRLTIQNAAIPLEKLVIGAELTTVKGLTRHTVLSRQASFFLDWI